MMKQLTTILLLSAGLIFSCEQQSNNSVAQDSVGARVDSLLSLMTLEEKVGQMNQYAGFWDVTGPMPEGGNSKEKYDHLKSGKVGSLLNVYDVEKVQKLQELVVNESRLGIPLIFGYDVIHGHKTLSPIPLAESCSWDLKTIEKSARVAATEASAMGINWTFAPMVDVSRDARWGRVMEGAGEDAYLGSKIAAARVKGFQGSDLSATNTIAACAKHFAGYGFSEAGRDYNVVDIGPYTLHNVVLPPFKAAVEAGVRTVMNSFNTLNGIPATGDSYLQRDILKGKWGFKGYVISDWASGAEMVAHGFAEDLADAAKLAANAGSDMDMESRAYIGHLVDQVKSGKVKESVVDEAVRRILRVKFELGLMDDPFRYCSQERQDELIYHNDHKAAVRDMAKRSIVLLKNEGYLLPLKKNEKRIAVIGALADDNNSPLGSWRLGSDNNTAVTVLEGLKKMSKDISYAKGADLITEEATFLKHVKYNTEDRSGFKEAVSLAKSSDKVIVVVGEHGFDSGEGRSHTKLDLPGVQQELLEAVYAANKNVILVVMSGRPLILNWASENIPTIVQAWHLGTESGNAIAEVLFGEYNPSGKLTMSFPRSVGQMPLYYNKYNTGRPDPLDIVFWSNYADESNDPLYPFGYGLSYTQFDYSKLQVNVVGNEVKVQATVTNSGPVAGEEVVQLYIRDRVASVIRPIKELKGFEKISLKPGEFKQVSFTLTEAELGFYNHQGDFITEPGSFDVMVGTSSIEGLKGEFNYKN